MHVSDEPSPVRNARKRQRVASSDCDDDNDDDPQGVGGIRVSQRELGVLTWPATVLHLV